MPTVTNNKSKSKYEEEVALIIRGDDPAATADNIASVSKLGAFLLVDEPDQSITDTYLNTENRDIRNASLRIREVNGKELITIKGKNINAGLDKPAVRSEIEVEWPWQEITPWDMADLFNLDVIQSRSTNRRVRNVYLKKINKLVAELAIDEVCYNFGDEPIRIFEVEIESLLEDESYVTSIAEALRLKFPTLLKKWSNSKLSTGNLLKIALGIETDETGLVTDNSIDNLATLFTLL